jgi:pilus assembly protein CpaE
MADKTKVLLVEVFPKVSQRIRSLLDRIDFIESMPNTITNSEMALAEIRQTKPDLVFLELDLPGLNGIRCTEIIKKDYPEIQVVILSEISSAESIKLAMRAGAFDYLNYNNLTYEELFSVVERATATIQQEKERVRLQSIPKEPQPDQKKTKKRTGKVITVYSPKGGAGVSTIVANLGYQMNKMRGDNRVILVDLDLQYGDIGLLFNQIGNRSIMDLAIRVQNLDEELVESVVFADESAEIDLLLSPQKLELTNEIDNSSVNLIINQLRTMYDFIIINTNSHLTESSLSCLALADIILLVTIQQVTAIRALRAFLTFIQENGISKEKLLTVINRFDESDTITSKKIGDMLSLIVSAIIPFDRKVAEKAANLGIPYTLDNPKLEISKAYLKLIESLKNKLVEGEKIAV